MTIHNILMREKEVEKVEERLLVEFGVEENIERKYGYEEKLLRFKGESIPYKAIVKNGELKAIVSRKYRLITNEEVIDIVRAWARSRGYEYNVDVNGNKVFVLVKNEDIGVLVGNSIDGTMGLFVDAVIYTNGVPLILRMSNDVKELKQVKKKHFRSAEGVMENLMGMLSEVIDECKEYKAWLRDMGKVKVKDVKDDVKELFSLMPKKYVADVIKRVEYSFDNGHLTLAHVYEDIARRIWSADTQMTTKIHLFRELNENVMFIMELVRQG